MSSSLNLNDDDHQVITVHSSKHLLVRRFLLVGTLTYALLGFVYLIYFSLGQDQFRSIFSLHDDVIFALNMSVNILIYAFPAFVAALLGSVTRILLSSNDSVFSHLRIIIGSGFIGVFAFLGLKSGLIYDLLVGSLSDVKVLVDVDEKKAFYKLIVLCVFTGMFATTMFLTIEERVNNLANKIKHNG